LYNGMNNQTAKAVRGTRKSHSWGCWPRAWSGTGATTAALARRRFTEGRRRLGRKDGRRAARAVLGAAMVQAGLAPCSRLGGETPSGTHVRTFWPYLDRTPNSFALRYPPPNTERRKMKFEWHCLGGRGVTTLYIYFHNYLTHTHHHCVVSTTNHATSPHAWHHTARTHTHRSAHTGRWGGRPQGSRAWRAPPAGTRGMAPGY